MQIEVLVRNDSNFRTPIPCIACSSASTSVFAWSFWYLTVGIVHAHALTCNPRMDRARGPCHHPIALPSHDYPNCISNPQVEQLLKNMLFEGLFKSISASESIEIESGMIKKIKNPPWCFILCAIVPNIWWTLESSFKLHGNTTWRSNTKRWTNSRITYVIKSIRI